MTASMNTETEITNYEISQRRIDRAVDYCEQIGIDNEIAKTVVHGMADSLEMCATCEAYEYGMKHLCLKDTMSTG
jgi:hypothetical protein